MARELGVVNGPKKMKKIEAVIFPVHLNAVRVELERLGIRSGLTLIEVHYSGGDRSLVLAEKRGFKKTQDRVKLELTMEDSEAEKAVNIILRHARPQSDQEGGQIAVLEVNEIPSATAVEAPDCKSTPDTPTQPKNHTIPRTLLKPIPHLDKLPCG
jgi:nitrogen regulatory protein PII